MTSQTGVVLVECTSSRRGILRVVGSKIYNVSCEGAKGWRSRILVTVGLVEA